MEVEVKSPHVAKELGIRQDAANGGGEGEERFGKVSQASIGERSYLNASSNSKDTLTISQGDQLESTKAEIGEVEEENQRLKMLLSQILKDYQSLQMHFFDIVKQEQPKNHTQLPTIIPHDDQPEETELVSLRLGANYSSTDQHKKLASSGNKENYQRFEGELNLGLDCKFEGSKNNNCNKEPSSNTGPEDSFKEHKEEEAGEPWPPSKMLKNLRSQEEDEALQQARAKKARVSVRVRCDAPTMNDGCQWRKYGQKIAKGNPCPRAYYRCTVAPACPVRRQVQRCLEDMSILITTYEGTHNHPLPMSATSMASTTSAAASMLMSGSSTSRSPTSKAFSSPTTIPRVNSGIHNLNFSLSDSSKTTPFYLPNATISPSPSYSTITLDLTAPPSSATQTSQFNRLSSTSSFSISMPSSWSSRGAHEQSYSKSQLQYSLNSSYNQPYMQKPTEAPMIQNSLTDSIAKAITSDPSFQSALEAAITSYAGTSGSKVGGINADRAALGGNGWASSLLARGAPSSSSPQ